MRPLALPFLLLCSPALASSSEAAPAALPATLAPAAARDDDRRPPRFLIVPATGSEPARVEALYTALVVAGASVVDRAARAGVDLPLAPALYSDAALDEPRAALLAARASLRALALDDVDASLEQAWRAALRLSNPSEHTDLLADILLLRAELALARDRVGAAERDLRLLARLEERRLSLHPGLFPPKLVAAYASARADNASAAPAYLSVHADAGEAPLSVLLDGRALAAQDARAGLDVKAGPHLVTLLAPGRVSRSFLFEASAAEPLTLEAQLFAPHADEARRAAITSLRAGPGDDAALVRLLETTGASALLWLRDEATESRPLTFTRERGRVALPAADGEAEPLARARAALVAAAPPVAALAERPPTSRAEPAPAAADADDLGALSWILGGGALVVVVVAVGAGVGALAFALQPGEEIPPPPVPVVGTGLGGGR